MISRIVGTCITFWTIYLSIFGPAAYSYVIDRPYHWNTPVCDCSVERALQNDACKSQCAVVIRVRRQNRKKRKKPKTTVPATTVLTTSSGTTSAGTTSAGTTASAGSQSAVSSITSTATYTVASSSSAASVTGTTTEMVTVGSSVSAGSDTSTIGVSTTGGSTTGGSTTTLAPTIKVVTTKPVTTVKEVTTKPVTTVKGMTTKPVTTVKVAVTTKPVTTVKVVTTKPVTTVKVVTTKPVTTVKPVTKKPATTVKGVTTKPITTKEVITVKVVTSKPDMTEKTTIKQITSGKNTLQTTKSKTTEKSSKPIESTNTSSAASGQNMVVSTEPGDPVLSSKSELTSVMANPSGTTSSTAEMTSSGSDASSTSSSALMSKSKTFLSSTSPVTTTMATTTPYTGTKEDGDPQSTSTTSSNPAFSTSSSSVWITSSQAEDSTLNKRTASTTLYQTTETKYYSQSSNNATEFPTEPEMVENEAWAVLKSQEYEFKVMKGKLKDDKKECKNQYGVVIKVLNPDSDGYRGYSLMCFKYKDLEKSDVLPGDGVVTVRIEKLKQELWWSNVDSLIRGTLIEELRDILSNHKHYSGLKNWKNGPFEVLYMEDTPMLVDYVSQIGVLIVSMDDMVIPGKLIKPVLQNIMHDIFKNSPPYGYGMEYYLYIGIPDMYMSTLVWSHNEFLASILACITLGSIILMVMVSALIAGVRSGGEDDLSENEDDDNTDINDESLYHDDSNRPAEIQETDLKLVDNVPQKQDENNLDSGEIEGCCCDITPDKADVIVNKFNITATGEEEARTEAEAANTPASTNLDQEEHKNTGSKKKCELDEKAGEGEEMKEEKCDPDSCSETDNTKKEGLVEGEEVKIVNRDSGEKTGDKEDAAADEEKEKEKEEVKELNN